MKDPKSSASSRWREKARALTSHPGFVWGHRAVVTLALFWCAKLFVEEVTPHYPIDHWLFWVYARIWVWVAFFMVACFSGGPAVM